MIKRLKKVMFSTLALAMLFCFVPAQKSYAATIEIHLKSEISVDSGATWHNYSDSGDVGASPGNETVSAIPGQPVMIRVKAWNAGDTFDVTPYGTFSIDGSYFDLSSLSVDYDYDRNGTNYEANYFTGTSGAGVIQRLQHNATESECSFSAGGKCEMALVTVRLNQTFPSGETFIGAEGRIDSYTIFGPTGKVEPFENTLDARGTVTLDPQVISGVRISTIIASSTVSTSSSSSSNLPETGNPISAQDENQKKSNHLEGILITFAAVIILGGVAFVRFHPKKN